MRTHKRYPSAHIGTPLLLVLLFALCLSALAVLTLSDALRNEGYSKQVAENTRNYYQADKQAKEQLAQIQDILESQASLETPTGSGKTIVPYDKRVLEQLGSMEGIALKDTETRDYFCVSYDVPIRDNLILRVSLNIYKENIAPQGDKYQIVQWQEMSLAGWNATTTLPVLGSD